MTSIDRSFLVLDPDETETAYGAALAAELRRIHPDNVSGYVARRLKITKRSAENILAGHVSARTLTRLVKAYGLGLLVDATARVTGETLEAYIRARADAARQEAQRWEQLQLEEPDFDTRRPSRAHRLVDHHRGDGRGP